MAVTVLEENFDSFTDWTASGTWTTSIAVGTGPAAATAGANSTLTYTIPGGSESDTVTVGFKWRTTSLGATQPICVLMSDSAATSHVTLQALTTGALEVRRGTGAGTVLATSAAATVNTSTDVYIELQAKLHDTTGFVTVRLNGVQVATNPTCDTKNAGTKTTFDRVRLATAALTCFFDECYIVTGSDGTFRGEDVYGTGPFDVIHEPFADLTSWTTGAGTPAIVTGRNGNAVQLDSTDRIDLPIPATPVYMRSDYMIIGFAVKADSLPATTADFLICRSAGVNAWFLRCTSTGVLSVNGTIAVTAAGQIVAGVWAYIEAKVLVRNPTGGARIRKNGTQVGANSSGQAVNTTQPDEIRLSKIGATGVTLIDDLYILTGTAAEWEGDQAIAEGAYVDIWNGSAFVAAPVSTWNGSAFAAATAVKTYNGSAFV